MDGMNEVGRLFHNNELIVAEVLQSAEAMKASVNHLEQFMEKSDTASRGKVILATVKGDVHDIARTWSRSFWQTMATRSSTWHQGAAGSPDSGLHEHSPDAIGLSGLLVKSAQQMVTTAGDLRDAGISVPLLVGGAALSERFTRTRIAPAYGQGVCYAKDAMTGLDLMNRLMDPVAREAVLQAFIGVEALRRPRWKS